MARDRRTEIADSSEETLVEFLRDSVRSTRFWSAISAAIGIISIIAGGALFLAIEEIQSFAIVVLVIGIVLLVLAVILAPRTVALFVVGRQGRYGTSIAIMTVAFFAILILVNFLLYRSPTRIDVTATRIFSLSPQTKQVLDNLDSDVMAHAFFVPGDLNTANAEQSARDLLNEFERRSSKFDFVFIDPDLEPQTAEKFNAVGFPVIVIEDVDSGRQQGVNLFTEGEFLTGILIATGEGQKVVYFLTGHNEASVTRDRLTGSTSETGFDQAIDGMQRDNYRTLPLNLNQFGFVPPNAAVLVIAGPKQDLDPVEFTALTEYISQGGRVVALLDPNTPESFIRLIKQWGVTLGRGSIVDPVSNFAGQPLIPLLQRTNGQYISSEVTGIKVTEEIGVTYFPDAAAVNPLIPLEDMPPHIRYTPLALTTPVSWLEEDIDNPGLNGEIQDAYAVAAVVEARGMLDDISPSGQTPVAKFVIFGDSDFATNRFFNTASDNADIFLNSVNWLAEDFDLISIRTRTVPFRELVVNTRERSFIRWSSWFFPPALMLVLGTIVWWRRR